MSQDLMIGETEYELFQKDNVVATLRAMEKANYSPLFMPEFAQLRIAHPSLFKDWGRTMSIRASGKTSAGSAVEIYAHIPGDWSQRQYISDAISEGKLIAHALPLTQESFDALEKRNGEMQDGARLVTVMDHAQAQKGLFGEQNLDEALENPHVRDFFGGEKQAQTYLKAHQNVHGNKIYVWHSNDLDNVPVARPLVLNNYYLISLNDFDYNRRVPGVRRRASVSEPGAHAMRDEAKNIYANSYVTLLANPKEALAALDDKTALGIEKIISDYKREAKQ